MAAVGFYNSNRNRSYPFLAGGTGGLPDSAVVDCGFLTGPLVDFRPGRDAIYLARVRRSGGRFTFEFASDCPDLAGVPLIFARAEDDPEYVAEAVEAVLDAPGGSASLSDSASSSSSAGPDGAGAFLWSGYLVTGPLDDLAAALPDGGVLERAPGGLVTEPALVQVLGGTLVAALNLANDDRTRVTAPEGCDAVAWPAQAGTTIAAARGLRGALELVPGYNAAVRQDSRLGVLTLGAAVGDGAGEPCAEVPLFAGEVPPEGSRWLGGGPDCGGVLRAINGVGGPLFTLTTGAGVSLAALPEEHRVVVTVDMHGLAVCYESASAVSESV